MIDVWPLVGRYNAVREKTRGDRMAGLYLEQHGVWTDGTHTFCDTCSGGHYREEIGEWPCPAFLGLEKLWGAR